MTIATLPAKNSVLQLCAVFAVVKILLHLYTNLFAGYGIFRDELYYVACTEHMAFGYVDHPPFSIWLLYVVKASIGKSLFAVRLLPALLGGGTVFLYGLITYELGGRKLAVSLTCLAVLLSGVHLAMGTFYSMNVIDMFLWTLALYGFIRLFKTGNARLWWWLAVLMGLMLLNKISALFFGAGLLIALLLTPERKWLATRWPFAAGAISVLLFSPYIIWNALNGWPHLEFIHNASTYKYQGMNPAVFWSQQLLIYNPLSLPLSVAGIIYAFSRQSNHYYRFIFLIFIGVGLILTVNWHSKPEYLAAIFPVLFVGGALQFQQWSERRHWVVYPAFAMLVLGIPGIPFGMPILPVDQYVAYANAVGLKPGGAERKELSDLPQFYADMFGWENQAKAIADAYHSLSPEDQEHCVLFGDNYGRAGAIDYYADKYDIPKAIGNHNNYWLWGTGDYNGRVLLTLSKEAGNKVELFEEVIDLGVVHTDHCMPYENDLHIFLCRGLKKPLPDVWNSVKSFI